MHRNPIVARRRQRRHGFSQIVGRCRKIDGQRQALRSPDVRQGVRRQVRPRPQHARRHRAELVPARIRGRQLDGRIRARRPFGLLCRLNRRCRRHRRRRGHVRFAKRNRLPTTRARRRRRIVRQLDVLVAMWTVDIPHGQPRSVGISSHCDELTLRWEKCNIRTFTMVDPYPHQWDAMRLQPIHTPTRERSHWDTETRTPASPYYLARGAQDRSATGNNPPRPMEFAMPAAPRRA